MQHAAARCAVSGLVLVLVTSLSWAAPAPPAAHAAPAECQPNSHYSTTGSRSYRDQIDLGDLHVYVAPRTSSLRVSRNRTFTVGSAATSSATVGAHVDAGVAVGWFNAGAGLTADRTRAVEVTRNDTVSVTDDVTVPAGHRMMAYAGHSFAKATVSRYHCRLSRGRWVPHLQWQGVVAGPRYTVSGYKDCLDTSLC